jgi:hypothetical protein
MLEHLIDFTPEVVDHRGAAVPIHRTDPVQTLDAQIATSNWLEELGAADTSKVASDAEAKVARAAFSNIVSAAPAEATHEQLAQIKTPEAVRHLVGMLTAFDWEFVNQAKELRGYTVAKLLEECENPNANIRLKALGLLGKVTEVGLFTERIEVKKTDLTDEEIDRKLKEKLAKFMDVTDADVTDIVEKLPTDETERPDAQSE